MDVAAHVFHPSQSSRDSQAADTVRHHFDEEGSDQVSEDGDESFDPGHASMMALSGRSVKTGKLGCDPGGSAKFSRLCKVRTSR
jgi:hypothetical protein